MQISRPLQYLWSVGSSNRNFGTFTGRTDARVRLNEVRTSVPDAQLYRQRVILDAPVLVNNH